MSQVNEAKLFWAIAFLSVVFIVMFSVLSAPYFDAQFKARHDFYIAKCIKAGMSEAQCELRLIELSAHLAAIEESERRERSKDDSYFYPLLFSS